MEKLKNAPIVEAVVDIECDIPPNFSFNAADEKTRAAQTEAVRKAFGTKYPQIKELMGFQHVFNIGPDAQSSSPPVTTIAAIQAISESGREIVQIRPQGFSFNRLAPYGGLDDCLPNIKEAWSIFANLVNPKMTRTIRLRYINVLPLPLIDGKVELGTYFKNSSTQPNDLGLSVTNFLSQYNAIEISSGFRVNIVISGIPNQPTLAQQGNLLSILFDNTAEGNFSIDPLNWEEIEQSIRKLRSLKNRTFEGTLTKQCLALFQ